MARKLTRLLVAVLVCSAFLGCKPRTESAGTEQKILRISQRNEPADLDPATASLPDEFFIIRALGEGLAKELGQTVIVDNKAGAGTVIGNDAVAKSPADGHTLLINTSAFAIAPSLPGAPTISGVTRGDGELTVHFDPPAATGGVALDSYTATCGSQSATGPAASTALRVTGLSNLVPVTCTVRASNVAGEGPESAPSPSIAPAPDLAFKDGFE